MKKETITAHHMVDGKKALAGSCVEDKPETIEELQDQFEDKEILKLVWASHVIKRQREMVAEATKGQKSKAQIATENEAKLKARAREMKAAGDSSLYDTLIALEVIKE